MFDITQSRRLPPTFLTVGYFLVITMPMGAVLFHDALYGGGNHWVFFGTWVDRLVQRSGYALAVILPLPLAAVAAGALRRRAVGWGVFAAGLTALCGVVAVVFVHHALD